MEKIDYEQEVSEALEFLNRMRAAPASVIPELVKMLGKFKGKNYMIEPNVQLQTQEGKEAVENAITFLSTQKAVKPYEINSKLNHAAVLLKDHLENGITEHPKKGPLSMKERLCNSIGKGLMGENLAFGNKSGKEAILSLLIDDGIPNRLHRKNLFSDEFTHTGMAMGSHTAYRHVAVINFWASPKKMSLEDYGIDPYDIEKPKGTTSIKVNTQMEETSRKIKFTMNYEFTLKDGSVMKRQVVKETFK